METQIKSREIKSSTMNNQDPFLFFEKNSEKIFEALSQLEPLCGFPLYTSIDVRDAGWKLGVVDVNIFPAGWNNLIERDIQRAAQKLSQFLESKTGHKGPWKVAVFPEANTNNLGYLENLFGLQKILERARASSKILWPGQPELPKPWTVKTLKGHEITYHPSVEALKEAELILLNHDLSGGIPESLKKITLPVFPSPNLGWFQRRKSHHFDIVDSILKIVSEKVPGFDPFYFSPRSRAFLEPDFESDEGLEIMAQSAESLLSEIQEAYTLRGIPYKPRLFMKNDAGTYGMGVISLKNPDEIRAATRKLKSKMRVGKESVPVKQILFQEAIPSALNYEDAQFGQKVTGEPVVYIVNGEPIGGFLRIHEKLGLDSETENLNQPGSILESLECPDHEGRPPRNFPKIRGFNTCQQLGPKQLYGFLAKLHSVAAGLEECPSNECKENFGR